MDNRTPKNEQLLLLQDAPTVESGKLTVSPVASSYRIDTTPTTRALEPGVVVAPFHSSIPGVCGLCSATPCACGELEAWAAESGLACVRCQESLPPECESELCEDCHRVLSGGGL